MSVIDKLRKRVAATTTRYDARLGVTVVGLPPCSCGECRACEARAMLDAYDTARAEGVAAERARVVAWLRAADSETLVWFAAQRIEQGWHDKEGT